ncbi:MAG: sugar ABC transporter ATP-binding protein [Victivallales bacterium]|nr:sugar ABC transporter ATP-binding protein [Victivallales bacterium]
MSFPGDTLVVQDLRKSYGTVEILHGVSLSLGAGEILGLVGENGAGKSTFIKCLNGVTRPSSGTICFCGKPLGDGDVSTAISAGLITIPQEFNLVPDLSVAENIFLGQEPVNRFGWLDKKTMHARAEALLTRLGAKVSPEQNVGTLSVAAKQMVEFAKALAYDCKLLILDEPTTVLNQNEVETLFQVLRTLRDAGTSLLFVSHKLREIITLCDKVAVLRDGELVALSPTSEVDEQELARRMVGRNPSQMFSEKPAAPAENEVALEVEHLDVEGVLHDVSFQLRRGEILGFAGLVGAGRTELAETIYGIRHPSAGHIRLFGSEVRFANPGQALAAGVAYLPEDRQGTGILTSFPLAANVTLSSLQQYCHPAISCTRENAKAQEYIHSFAIKAQSPQDLLQNLSGGNQQKVSIAKCLDTHPRVFLFDEPTRGIDIQAKAEVYVFIRSLVAQGMSCILISSDLEEVIGLCRRIAVMRDGTIAGFVQDDQISEESIMFLATGVEKKK